MITYLSKGCYTAVLLFVFSIILICVGCSTAEQPVIKVGLGETIITPPVGAPMAGYNRADVSKGVHDDLYARSIAIEDGDGTGAVMMTLGLVNISRSLANDIRTGIEEQTRISGDNIIISCTHTHSGPEIGGTGKEYRKLIVDRSVESAVTAWNTRFPGRIGTGSAVCRELGKNDRRMEYGGIHPDPEVGIIKIEDARGKLKGVAFNYGCHPSTLDLHNFLFTEDWPYFSIKGIKESVGEDVWVAYFQSAQGDTKIGYTAELSAVGADMQGIRSFEYAEHKGNMMVDEVVEALPSITTSGNPVIKTAIGYYDYPRRNSYPITAKEAEKQLNAARDKLAEMEKKADLVGKRVLDRYKVEVFLADLTLGCAQWVERNPNPEPYRDFMHQAIRIGDAVFVTFPCEVFTEIGLKVKEQSPYEKTFVIGLASGQGGYIPTAAEYLEGGYAVAMTHYSPECEQVCIDASLEMIGKVK